METNGKVYCDLCHCNIEKQKHVRVARPTNSGDDTAKQPNAHFHDRFKGDCWSKVKDATKKRNENKKPTPADMTEYQKWLAQRDAKAAAGKGA